MGPFSFWTRDLLSGLSALLLEQLPCSSLVLCAAGPFLMIRGGGMGRGLVDDELQPSWGAHQGMICLIAKLLLRRGGEGERAITK